jgi:hypothetical protein
MTRSGLRTRWADLTGSIPPERQRAGSIGHLGHDTTAGAEQKGDR